MSFRTVLFTLVGVTASSAALAEIDVADLAQSYVAQGYSRVEVTSASGEVRVEAIKGATGVEVVYDRATALGAGRASARDRAETGVSFVALDSAGRRGRGADDAGEHRGRGRDDNGADDNGGRGRGRDDNGADDNGGRGRGGDDDGRGDDRGRGRGAEDRGGDDHGGRGRGRDD